MSDTPKFTDSLHEERKDDLAVMHAFKGGKKRVKKLLHKWERETDAGYLARQNVCTLYNQTRKTIKTANGMIFRKSLSFKDLNKDFEEKSSNIDGSDTSLNDFAKDVNEASLWDGISYILVDTPSNNGQEIVTLQQQLSAGIIPYFTKVTNAQILNRRIENNKLTQITIQENVKKYTGEFKEEIVTQERVLYIGGGALFQDDELIDIWENKLDYIPLVPVYSNKLGYFDASPRYLDLAELNLKHFNYQSQLDKTLFIASNPIPKVWGNAGKELTIGVDQAMSWDNKEDGDFEWCEFQGTSVEKLQEEISKTEARMLAIGISLLTDKEQTATEVAINSAGETSDLASMASSLETSLNTAYGYWCEMMGKTNTGTIGVNKDFTGIALSPQDAKMYLDMYNSGTISLSQFWDEMEGKEYLKPFDRDVVKSEIEAENQNTDLEG